MRKQKSKIMFIAIAFVFAIAALCSLMPTFSQTQKAHAANANRQSIEQAVKLTSKKDAAATLTVLIPGLNGGAAHFSNDLVRTGAEHNDYEITGTDSFVFDSTSLIEQLRNASNAPVYLASGQKQYTTHEGETNFVNVNCDADGICDSCSNIGSEIPVDWQLCDAPSTELAGYIKTQKDGVDANSAVLVVEGTPEIRGDRHKVLFDEVEYMINQASYDIYLKTGNVPKVNLIGYSRGGNIAVMYASEYPYNVDNIVTINTPHMGSNLGDLIHDHPLDIEALGDMFASPGANDCISREVTDQLIANWNQAYVLNPDMNAYPIGSFVDISFIEKLLSSYSPLEDLDVSSVLNILSDHPKMSLGLIKASEKYLKYILTFIRNFVGFDTNTYNTLLAAGESIIPYLNLNEVNGESRIVLMDDLFIDYYSQIGSNQNRSNRGYYHGFEPIYRKMVGDDPTVNFDKRALNNVPVAHNLAVRDAMVIDAICYKLLEFDEEFSAIPLNQTECVLTHAKDYAEIQLPEKINGKNVVGIAQNAFSNNPALSKITISSNVKWIGESAFANCKNLSTIIFSSSAQLESIADQAFYGCPLTTLNLPASFQNIKNSAISSCKNLILSVNSNNQTFSVVNNILYNKAQTELKYYPLSNHSSEFTVPASVKLIKEGAFYGNEYLQRINLNNVEIIQSSAFQDCTVLFTINGNQVDTADQTAFEGTAWAAQNGPVKLSRYILTQTEPPLG